MQPAALILCLPLADSESVTRHDLDQAPGHEVGPSAIAMDVGPDLAHYGFSVVSFASLLDLGTRFPHLRSLLLRSIIVKPDEFQGFVDLTPSRRFSLLERLTIVPGFAQTTGETPITTSLFMLFPHMPRLRDLTVYAPMLGPHYEADSAAPYPEPPFSLKRLICVGGLSVSACAHIIAHSRRTLEELKINVGMSDAEADQSRLVAAIAQAAPHLRFLDLRLRGSIDLRSHLTPMLAALVRVETLRLELPLLLEDALALIAGCSASLRELSLSCTRYPFQLASEPAAQLSVFLSRAPLLRSVTLRDFAVGDENHGRLLKLCRARRIRCKVR